jgi:endonuclease G, mitochondrial
MKIKALALTLILSFNAFASCDAELAYGTPDGDGDELLLCKSAFLVGFDAEIREPRWTLMILDQDSVNKSCDSQPDFIPDPTLPKSVQENDSEFYKNVWDKGHLSDRASVDSSCESEQESVYYTNAVPQHEKMNRVGWRILEKRIRDLVNHLSGAKVYVLTGTITETYNVVPGTNLVIPDKLYKVIYIPEIKESAAFVYNNEPLKTKDLYKGVMTVSEFESKFNIHTFDIDESIKSEVGSVLKTIL